MTESRLVLAGQDISACCKKIIPGQTDELLLNKLQSLVPDCTVRLALTGDEWYRLGGVVDIDGKRIANDLIEWVDRTYLECGQNLQTLIDHAVEQQLFATKVTGKTLHFVVQTGDLAEDFTLIEIDKTQEVSDRMLVDEQRPPEDLEEFVDPCIQLASRVLVSDIRAMCISVRPMSNCSWKSSKNAIRQNIPCNASWKIGIAAVLDKNIGCRMTGSYVPTSTQDVLANKSSTSN